MLNKKESLFISYDGLSDPLGQSQILPYILNISKHPRNLYLISFEKKIRLSNLIKKINDRIEKKNIKWFNLNFTSKYGKIGKLYDLLKLFCFSFYLVLKFDIKIVHGRGLIPSLTALLLKKIFFLKKIKVIFDCRGLWADERVDNNILKKDKKFDNFIFNFLKLLERYCVKQSDQIIFLTSKVKKELEISYDIVLDNSTIIPCCVDFNEFNYNNKKELNKILRKKLNIPIESIVFNYNGSLTGVYLFKDMLLFFKKIKKQIPDCFFIITSPDTDFAKKIISNEYGYLKESIIINEVNHSEIPKYLSISNFSLGFIKQTYARCAMSPTKFAESLALGVPVIYNDNIGDVTSYILKLEAGIIIDYNKNSDIENFVLNFKKIIDMGGEKLVNNSKKYFDISVANKKYLTVYDKLDS